MIAESGTNDVVVLAAAFAVVVGLMCASYALVRLVLALHYYSEGRGMREAWRRSGRGM